MKGKKMRETAENYFHGTEKVTTQVPRKNLLFCKLLISYQLVPRLRPWNASGEALPRVRDAEPQVGIPRVDAGNECETAENYFHGTEKYNCAQAILAAFQPHYGYDSDLMRRIKNLVVVGPKGISVVRFTLHFC